MISENKSLSVNHQNRGTAGCKGPTTFTIITLGCKVNQYESESIARELVSSGCRQVGSRQSASIKNPDICIINTCTVTGKAAMQSRQAIRQVIRSYPEAEIIVTGCLAQTAPEEIQKIEGVRYIMGHADKFTIPDITKSIRPGRGSGLKLIHSDIKNQRTYQDMCLPALGGRTRPFLKIQDGCDAYCTYCIVPFARGPSRSMPLDRVMRHIRSIREAGYHEIVLTGIHLGRYGADLSPGINLFQLLKHLHAIRAMDRIRLSSVEPLELTPELIELVAVAKQRPGQICAHFHIPLQSGDNDILKRMHRPYRRHDFRERVRKIMETIPHAAIGADVLIGFPGETEEAFMNTFRLLTELPLAYLHVFPFSPRKGTPAAAFPDHVPSPIVKERCKKIRELGMLKRRAFMTQWLHKEVEVLVETTRDPLTGLLKGVTSNYLKVIMDGADPLQNTFRRVHVEGLKDEKTLQGRL